MSSTKNCEYLKILLSMFSKSIEIISKLDTLSPLKTLTRGYTIASKKGKSVRSIKDVKIDDEIDILLFIDLSSTY